MKPKNLLNVGNRSSKHTHTQTKVGIGFTVAQRKTTALDIHTIIIIFTIIVVDIRIIRIETDLTAKKKVRFIKMNFAIGWWIFVAGIDFLAFI